MYREHGPFVEIGLSLATLKFMSRPDGKMRILIEPNVQVPTYSLTTDIVMGGVPLKGWVGIVISQEKKRPADWRTRAAQWLNHVFLGKP